jgi:hypothetical protein
MVGVTVRRDAATMSPRRGAPAGSRTAWLSSAPERAGGPVDRPGAVVRLLVLAAVNDECAAAELSTGAFVRARSDAWAELAVGPYDVVECEGAARDEIPDPARPETVYLAAPPRPVGRLPRRKARRFLDRIASPGDQPLLGFAGPSVPYWTMTGISPSLALVRLDGGLTLMRDGPEEIRARFRSSSTTHVLPVADPRLAELVAEYGSSYLDGRSLEEALGQRPGYVLVAVAPPQAGHCYKVVAALLPTP